MGTFDKRAIGSFRTVFDLNCRFYGVIVRGKTSHRSCIELSDHVNINAISPVSNIYRGYQCRNMIFEIPYVQASLTVAREKNLKKKKPNIYPIKISQPGVDGDKYEWPLCRKNNIYGPNYRSKHGHKYYVSYSDRSDAIQVIDKSNPIWRVCPLIARTIVSGNHKSDSISALEHVVHDNKKSYDCGGQIFTDYYVQEVYTTMMKAISGRQLSDLNKHYHHRFVKVAQVDATNKIWIWHLRITETDFQYSEAKTGYILAMSQKYQLIGVYKVRKGVYVQCNKKHDSTGYSTKGTVFDVDLNEDYAHCERCKDDTGCGCEETLHDPKRRKIL
ncbi:BgTH12-02478 [Blumeria graminis f. sp. triticale]|uniref:BgTH12-02478 n=1 Tax=Blumeria graminis f. sp. triticale TaxID=1689686 RepID=A0A9W4GE57_BLUGR|nr:BgTH12-02478 [Blumeria graminis f. sp. triticale]